MTDILLSFCIPTYNRPDKLYSLVEELLSFESDKIEILIGDDNPASDRSFNLIKKFRDKRIRYIKNKSNLGLELNFLKLFNLARGKFVCMICDDDMIEIKTIPIILDKISENSNLSQICCSIAYEEGGIYYKFGTGLIKKGIDSLLKFLFYYGHASGIILRRDTLDIKGVVKYCGKYCVSHSLVAQAMMSGDTLCIPNILVYTGSSTSERSPVYKNRLWWHPLSGLVITKYRIKVINEIIPDRVKSYFLDIQEKNIYSYLYNLINLKNQKFMETLKNIFNAFSIIIRIKEISKSLSFWINMLLELSIRIFPQDKNLLLYIIKNLKEYTSKEYKIPKAKQ